MSSGFSKGEIGLGLYGGDSFSIMLRSKEEDFKYFLVNQWRCLMRNQNNHKVNFVLEDYKQLKKCIERVELKDKLLKTKKPEFTPDRCIRYEILIPTHDNKGNHFPLIYYIITGMEIRSISGEIQVDTKRVDHYTVEVSYCNF